MSLFVFILFHLNSIVLYFRFIVRHSGGAVFKVFKWSSECPRFKSWFWSSHQQSQPTSQSHVTYSQRVPDKQSSGCHLLCDLRPFERTLLWWPLTLWKAHLTFYAQSTMLTNSILCHLKDPTLVATRLVESSSQILWTIYYAY